MGDTYVECLVARKSGMMSVVVKALLYGVTAFCVIAGLFYSFIFLIVAIAFIIVSVFVAPSLDLEFEYLYMDKELSVDKIMSKSKRKKVKTFDLNKMEILAPEKSHEMDSYKNRNIKVLDYSSKDENDNIYLMMYRDEEGECLVRFNPNEEMLKAIKTVLPRKVVS